VLPEGTVEAAVAGLKARFEEVRAEFAGPDPDMRIQIEEAPMPESVWSDDTGARVLDLIVALPHGVVAMSHDIPGLVETSTNLAAVHCDGAEMQLLTSSRSSVASGMDWIRSRIGAVATLAGATTHHGEGYPGWKPDLDSELLHVVQAVHERVLGVEPRIEAVHAGLECGIIGEMVPGMEMISFGPQIEFPHSPGERVKVDSVEPFYRLLTGTLEELAG
jgi:dipeptidase D